MVELGVSSVVYAISSVTHAALVLARVVCLASHVAGHAEKVRFVAHFGEEFG
jgi:hypothetical protein